MTKEEYKIKRIMNTKRWRDNNPEKVKEYNRMYEKKEKAMIYRKKYRILKGAINSRKWRTNNPIKSRDSYYKYQYGISFKEYEEILKNQNNVCAICGNKTDRNLCVDHNHETGEVRGLLCLDCNSALGHFKDNKKYLNNAIKYLNSNNSNK
jgi:hypothetical protein